MRTPRKQQAAAKALVGARVRLATEIRTKGGSVYPEGSLWEVYRTWKLRYDVRRLNEDGTVFHKKDGCVQTVVKLHRYDFYVVGYAPKEVTAP